MKKNTKSIENNMTNEQQEKLLKAKKNFKKIQERIAPFIKLRKFKDYSTTGKWCRTSNYCR